MSRYEPLTSTQARWIGYGLLTLAALFLYGAAWNFSIAREKLNEWAHVEGVVLRNEKVKHSRSRGGSYTCYYPVFQFTAADTITYTAQSGHGEEKAQFRPGDRVEVLYPAGEPTEAVLATEGHFDLTWILGGVGLFLSLLGGGFTLASRQPG